MQFRRKFLLAALSAIPLAILSIFLLMQSEFNDSRELRRLVDQSLETRADLADLLSTHLNIETGQRGYLLTADNSFLGPYSAGKQQIERSFRSLSDQLADEPELAGGILRLRQLTDAKLAFVDSTVALTGRGDVERARAMVTGGDPTGHPFRQRLEGSILEVSMEYRVLGVRHTEPGFEPLIANVATDCRRGAPSTCSAYHPGGDRMRVTSLITSRSW